MLAKVIGKADGQEIVFSQNERGLWQCPVPYHKDGEYIVELFAIDIAGNESYYATVLFVIDTSQLCIRVIDEKFFGEKLGDKAEATMMETPFFTELLTCKQCRR